jgi:uncharacterized protein (DUF1015 family)
MPRFEPFRGLRYDPATVRLEQVIAPPYDVIGSAERVTLANRNPANSVQVELPEPDLQRGLDRYQVAAGLLASWIEKGILVSDPAPAFYPYRMTSPDGRVSTGVIGALGMDDDVLPHEQTLPKPRSDRLDLLRATGANLSPIWGLSLTAGLSATFDPQGPPAGDVFDDDGVRHQIWVLDDPSAVEAVRQAIAASPVVVADGHHRYETARAYRAADDGHPGDHDLVMALVVELAEDQLTVGPIHRTLGGLPEGTDLPAVFGRWFDVVHAGPASERVVGALGSSRSLALMTPDEAWLLTPRPEAYEVAGSDLDASLVALAVRELPEHESTHQHSWQEAFADVKSGTAQAAVLLRPVTVAQIAEWAAARRRMPPKTTYFSPKPRTGMVFRRLVD